MIGILITLIIVIPISIAWVIGIDKNKDYKGEDFLNQAQLKKNKRISEFYRLNKQYFT